VLIHNRDADRRPARPDRPVVHDLYGIRVRTPWAIRGVPATDAAWDVEFVEGDAAMLADAAAHVSPEQRDLWAQYAVLPDGSRYRRWSGLFEFLVTPDARCIHARTLHHTNNETLLAYLLVDALSYAMVRLGREPLHATAVLTEQGVVAFVGESGRGKSTLGALFVRHGCRLVTDDMLVLTHERDGCMAHPGPPRIKLYRDIADRIFGEASCGVAMNPQTDKLIMPLADDQVVRQPAAISALYLIRDNHDRSRPPRPFIRQLSPASAFPEILAATAGHYARERDRLTRQFEFVRRLVEHVPIKTLSYPRDKDSMSSLRDAVLGDLDRSVN
jgi:hypothetical protein